MDMIHLKLKVPVNKMGLKTSLNLDLHFNFVLQYSLMCVFWLFSKETPTPQRKGLRSSALRPKRPETPKQTGPVIMETWVAEEELELWEIRAFAER